MRLKSRPGSFSFLVLKVLWRMYSIFTFCPQLYCAKLICNFRDYDRMYFVPGIVFFCDWMCFFLFLCLILTLWHFISVHGFFFFVIISVSYRWTIVELHFPYYAYFFRWGFFGHFPSFLVLARVDLLRKYSVMDEHCSFIQLKNQCSLYISNHVQDNR